MLQRRRWTRVRSIQAAAGAAPNAPGIYVIVRTHHVAGLPLAVEPAYVGKSLNLGERLKQHCPMYEMNPCLRAWLVEHAQEVEVAFTLVDYDEMDLLEQELIRRLLPTLNRIRYRG